MTAILASLVLLAAVLHASWNAMLKGGRDRVWTMMVMQMVTLTVSAVALPFLPLPSAASWPWLAAGALTHAGYRASLVRAFGHGELGEIYPISRGASPIMVTAGAAIVDGDHPGWVGLAGILLNSIGIMTLRRSGTHRLSGPALVAALMTAACTASYTIMDGTGARLAGAPLSFIVWLFFLGGLGTVAWSLLLRRGRIRPPIRETGRAVMAGMMSMAAYGCVIWASAHGTMGSVAALRETSVVFAVLIGRLFLNETLGGQRLVSCTVVAAGCACIAL
jgi:drug/metabolite transporter (DMT)-like permease